ncbi:MAG: nucleotidyltransferase domain-containing protein [Nitrospirae bacterium]|nr:nucleotidyltransferase domain-containing protein [Nitrospirota bacterium]
MAMKKFNELTETKKITVQNTLKSVLEKHPDICFAYLHGSFVKREDFNDIDVALYLVSRPAAPLEYELSLEAEFMDVVRKYPVDVRVLNTAPLSFRYNVIKEGVLLIVNDDEKRTGFQEATLADYFDFAPYRMLYLKEALGIGV